MNKLILASLGTAIALFAFPLSPVDAYKVESTLEIPFQLVQANNNLQESENAIAELTKVIESNPQDAKAYYKRGMIYFQLKQYEKAIPDFTKAIDIDSQFAEAYNTRGFAYVLVEQYEKGIADFTKGIELNPQDPYAYQGRGMTYIILKQADKGIPDLKKAAEIYRAKGDTDSYQKVMEILQVVQQ